MMDKNGATVLAYLNENCKHIFTKIFSGKRISAEECLTLYNEASLSALGFAANYMCEQKNKRFVYFNKNIHIEPTNICIHNCVFCSYARKKNQEGSWELSVDEIVHNISANCTDSITEFHIVGGVHPERKLDFYVELLTALKLSYPKVHIKAFTAVEIEFMAIASRCSFKEALAALKNAGLDSMPGGGAEIFDTDLRKKICPSKTNAENWLTIHETAHNLNIPTTATMLYGHIESYEHRVSHLLRLRNLQDKTGGFHAFIPLKYKKENNPLGLSTEVSWVEVLRNFAVSRIFLDNFNHIKAYWPMIGKDLAQISLDFGVDDFDGTINDSTKIYSMAGADDTNPSMTQEQMVALIKEARKVPVERDSVYNTISIF